MSEADKLFIKLGYEIKINCKECVCYKTKHYFKRRYTLIDFDLENKTVQIVENKNRISEESCFSIYKGTHKITIEELKAISLKCKELGWIEE